MPGRPPKPSALKALQGNPGKRPLQDEVKPAVGCTPPPWFTAPAALAEWNRLAPRLTRLRLLTENDGEALALLCAHLADAGEQVRMGRPLDPRLTSEIRQFFSRFGMDPASRAKVTGVPGDEKDDPFAGWTGGKVVGGGKKG